jgi:hypothetical protein
MVARSRPETITEAAQATVHASDWERDREAWNLPRAPRETIAGGADKNERDADPGGQGAGRPALSADTTE